MSSSPSAALDQGPHRGICTCRSSCTPATYSDRQSVYIKLQLGVGLRAPGCGQPGHITGRERVSGTRSAQNAPVAACCSRELTGRNAPARAGGHPQAECLVAERSRWGWARRGCDRLGLRATMSQDRCDAERHYIATTVAHVVAFRPNCSLGEPPCLQAYSCIDNGVPDVR